MKVTYEPSIGYQKFTVEEEVDAGDAARLEELKEFAIEEVKDLYNRVKAAEQYQEHKQNESNKSSWKSKPKGIYQKKGSPSTGNLQKGKDLAESKGFGTEKQWKFLLDLKGNPDNVNSKEELSDEIKKLKG